MRNPKDIWKVVVALSKSLDRKVTPMGYGVIWADEKIKRLEKEIEELEDYKKRFEKMKITMKKYN